MICVITVGKEIRRRGTNFKNSLWSIFKADIKTGPSGNVLILVYDFNVFSMVTAGDLFNNVIIMVRLDAKSFLAIL